MLHDLVVPVVRHLEVLRDLHDRLDGLFPRRVVESELGREVIDRGVEGVPVGVHAVLVVEQRGVAASRARDGRGGGEERRLGKKTSIARAGGREEGVSQSARGGRVRASVPTDVEISRDVTSPTERGSDVAGRARGGAGRSIDAGVAHRESDERARSVHLLHRTRDRVERGAASSARRRRRIVSMVIFGRT